MANTSTHGTTHKGASQRSHTAAETRKEQDPEAFKKMGEKGGHARHGEAETHREKDSGASSKMSEKRERSRTSAGKEEE